jgi:hypothetical protein
MRLIVSLVAVLTFVASVEEEDFEFEDDPIPREEVNFDEEALAKDEEEAQKVDATLSLEEKKSRMSDCLSLVKQQVSNPDSDMEEYISKFTEGLGEKIAAQQALQYLQMEFIKNCYLGIPQAEVGSEISNERAKKLILTRAQPKTLHRAQWELLSDLLKAEASEDKKQLNMEILGGRLHGWQKVAYVGVVVGVVFGLGYYVLMALTKADRARLAAKENKRDRKKKN